MTDKMPTEHYRSLRQLEDTYWWHQARYRIAARLIADAYEGETAGIRLADVGCGTGGFLAFLRAAGWADGVGFDASPAALDSVAARGLTGHPLSLDAHFRLTGAPYEAIVALDVMEHLKDDAAFLQACSANLSPAGILVLTVPAFPHLFSVWDRRLQHYRRYRRPGLRLLLQTHGFTPLADGYFFSFVYPLALARRWLGWFDGRESCEFPPVSGPLSRLLTALCRGELALSRLPRPFGTSLAVVARRTAN